MRRRAAAAGGASARLQEQIAQGQSYEALQTARALFARYTAQGKPAAARDLALKVAVTFAEAGEAKSALDLARLYITGNSDGGSAKVMEVEGAGAAEDDSAHRYSQGGREKMLDLARRLPVGAEKVALLKGIFRWGVEETTEGDGEVNLELASALRSIGEHGAAAQRLAAAEDPAVAPAYVQLIAEWAPAGYPSEVDLFVARAVIDVLSGGGSGALGYARALSDVALADARLSPRLADSPVFHFTQILLDLLQYRHRQGSSEAFKLLRAHYAPSLRRDPWLAKPLERVGEVYFGIAPPPNPMASLMSMFGGGMGM